MYITTRNVCGCRSKTAILLVKCLCQNKYAPNILQKLQNFMISRGKPAEYSAYMLQMETLMWLRVLVWVSRSYNIVARMLRGL